jgi:4-hydroxy-tetrahydrodipicolinate reductase
MITKIIVNGASGKMGSLACQTLQDHPDFELVAALGRHDNLGEAIDQTKANIVVDLTRADSAYANASTIIQHQAHPVIGTTGLTDEQIQTLQQQCQNQKLGGIIVPNFSINAILMMHCAALCARFQSEVEILEIHHQKKQDAPSGTALKTADMIANARVKLKNQLENTTSLPGARGASYRDINIHSLRLPGFVAKQEVIFGSTGESLSIIHECIDRTAYMPGLILACQGVQNLTALYYGLEKLIQL